MVKRACLPSINRGLRLKNVLFYGVWVLMKEWWELNLDTFIYIIPQLSRGVFFIAISLLVVPFQSFYALLPFLWFLGRYMYAWGVRRHSRRILFFWVRGARWKVVQGTSLAIVWKGGWGPLFLGQHPSLLAGVTSDRRHFFSTIFYYLILTKSNVILQAIETSLMAVFSENFPHSLRIWSVEYLGYRVMQGIPNTKSNGVPREPSYVGHLRYRVRWGISVSDLCGVPRLPSYAGYSEYRVRRGTSMTKLCGVPRLPNCVGYLSYRVVQGTLDTEFCGVPWLPSYVGSLSYRIMGGTPDTSSDF